MYGFNRCALNAGENVNVGMNLDTGSWEMAQTCTSALVKLSRTLHLHQPLRSQQVERLWPFPTLVQASIAPAPSLTTAPCRQLGDGTTTDRNTPTTPCTGQRPCNTTYTVTAVIDGHSTYHLLRLYPHRIRFELWEAAQAAAQAAA